MSKKGVKDMAVSARAVLEAVRISRGQRVLVQELAGRKPVRSATSRVEVDALLKSTATADLRALDLPVISIEWSSSNLLLIVQ